MWRFALRRDSVRFGSVTGRSAVTARTLLIALALACVVSGCSPDPPPPSTPVAPVVPENDAPIPLVIPTYDGSGQATEPKVLYFPLGWHGFSYWMAMTPYPYSDASKENPSILVSSDGQTWRVPQGLVNPVAPQAGRNLDDPELFYDASSDELWLYYLEEVQTYAQLMLRTSSDGIQWSSPVLLFTRPNYQLFSPTVAKNGGQYLLWGINSGLTGCSAPSTEVFLEDSLDGRTWSPPQTLQISQSGFVIWHISVIWVQAKQEFWTLYAAYPDGSNCGRTSLFFARSPDGIHWITYSKPAMVPGKGWDSRSIYRSTLVYHPDMDLLQVWFSADGDNYVWSIGFTERTYGDFVNLLQ